MKHKYALVAHSGLDNAVEATSVTKAKADLIEKAGGMVFENYEEADKAEYTENYPEGLSGLYPRPRGLFHKVPGFGQLVYIPRR